MNKSQLFTVQLPNKNFVLWVIKLAKNMCDAGNDNLHVRLFNFLHRLNF